VTRILPGRVFLTAQVLLLLIGMASVQAQTPVAHWKFDDGTSNTTTITAVDSANGNDALWLDPAGSGLSWTTKGQIGGAAVLDGANGSLRAFEVTEIPQLDFAQALSISLWFNPSSQGQTGDTYKGLAMTRSLEDTEGLNRNWGVAWEGGNRVDNRNGGSGGLDSANDLTATNTWYHVVAIWDGDAGNFGANPSKNVYVNGVQSIGPGASTISAVTDLFDSGTWFLGKDSANNNRNFRGLLDDVAFYTEVLSPAQVTTIYNNGLAGKDVNGVAGPVFLDGDVNGDTFVNDADFQIIRSNFYSSVTSRGEGDLVGDGFVDFDDFRQWKNNAASVAAGAAVPEPCGMALLASLTAGGLCLTRCRRSIRGEVVVACTAILLGITGSPVWAQSNIVLSVDRATGDATLLNAGNATGTFDGYVIQSNLGAITAGTWNSLQNQSVAGWQEAGIATANFLSELKQSGQTSLAANAGLGIGQIYSATAAMQAAGLGNDNYEDLAFTLNDALAEGGPVTTNPPVAFSGPRPFNNLVVTLNRETGQATITNQSLLSVNLDGYAFTSTAGSLNTAWNSLQDQANADWAKGGSLSANVLTELKPTSSTVLANGATLTLANTFDPAAGALAAGFGVDPEDIVFEFGDQGLEDSIVGVVQYTGEKVYNNLVINVDIGSGAVTLENESPHTVEIDGYSIASASGSLDPSALTSLGGGFVTANPSANRVSELNPTSALTLAPAATKSLGNLFAGGALDLSFEFDFAEPNSFPVEGVVKYEGGRPGDFDRNGVVDGFDLLAWQRGESPNELSAGDFGDWEANFGVSGGAAIAASVPEPTAWILAAWSAMVVTVSRRRMPANPRQPELHSDL
jgi:hypothetical protein